ncbi:DUF4136 domain-containing protein [uncultured Winogradskyella sp.]|uniref:DUF4136 domain-containing protein n=2 Tax=uncultured Winogradskyella sp. TaxID=395353 RepID=UPI002633B0B2|nr:DUF4136 domain-containing protein [uncultured Winogradskyella sp.]|tara:strand:- start:10669 stop:11190 length:522 start_codon:yes stop_codon:yes gene_type:complete
MKNLKFLFIAFLVTSCGTVVNYDYEKSTDFSSYKNYNYFDDMETGLSELDTKRLKRAIDGKLKTMGLTRSDTPDFYIDIQSQQVVSRNNSSVGVGLGGGGGGGFGGVSVGIPVGQNKQSREIVIDFVDENKIGLFWQAVSESNYNPNSSPEKREAVFAKLVEKVFTEYPPQKN